MLQLCFHIQHQVEDNLLTCVLLSALEIITGKQAWLWHRRGAVALLDTFPTLIEPHVASFAAEYFRSRCILTSTVTGPEDDLTHVETSRASSGPLPANGPVLNTTPEYSIDPYIGCSGELLGLINNISDLSLRRRSSEMPERAEEAFIREAQMIEDQLHHCMEGVAGMLCYSLSKSVESFQIAALIYLHITCFGRSPDDIDASGYHHRLITCLTDFITEDRRQICPMWPLFIAGCSCCSDEQRATVWNIFLGLKIHWPFHNIIAVKRAVWTVWQTRDHAKPPSWRAWQDWQVILGKFNWRLCLT